ncbi:MAG: hypothetical protein CDV28_1337 [Candidatus Electronema aureum]|uniref:Uncharacterized protein n=1 Tax=Candidatus Electronema aureum TaxID=2005002 RepID=A0A521FZR1_9BACT|nr:MAG: hypothetical protein CDV28_1337 [Candidatus Electronema aureum]
MEPVTTTIVAAVALGAAESLKNVAAAAVKDAYNGLKQLIQSRYGGNADVTDAVDLVSQKPEAAPRRQMLEQALKDAGVDKDQELHQLAQQLLAALKKQPGGEEAIRQTTVEQHVVGHGNVVAGTGDVTAGNISITI